jgi:hypothetical protein
MLTRIWRWWCREWDYLYIVGIALLVAWLVGGIISATIDAVRQAAVYH